MTSQRSVFNSCIVSLSVAYLLLPNVLFLLGWVQWWLAVPICLLLIGASCHVLCKAPRFFCQLSRSDLWWLICTLLFCILAIESLGYTGRVEQSFDFLARNPMYSTLVRCDWPLLSNTGDYFVYYHIFYLPPALIAKLLSPPASPESILYAWSFIGVALAGIILTLRFGAKRGFMVMLIIFCMGYLTDYARILVTASAQLATDALNPISSSLQRFTIDHSNAISSVWRGVAIDSPHHGIPLLVLLTLIATGRIATRHSFFVAAFVVLASPFGAISTLLFLLIRHFKWLKDKQNFCSMCKGISWAAVPLLFCAAVYLGCAEGSLGLFSPIDANGGIRYVWTFQLLICLASVIVPAWLFTKTHHRKTTWFASLITLCLCVFLISTPGTTNHPHNFALKGSFVLSFIQAWLYSALVFQSTGARRKYLIFFIIACSSYAIIHTAKQITTFTLNPIAQAANRQSAWGGHMNHQEHEHYDNFFVTPPTSRILYTKDGESAIHILSPFATEKKASDDPQ